MDDQRRPRSDASDETLVERVAERDVAAFTVLYDRYVQSVYSLAAHMLHNTGTAEEIVQEVFLRLWNNADQFDSSRGSFKVWFMAIARYRVLDELQHRSRRQRLLVANEIDQLLETTKDPDVDVEEAVWLRTCGDALLEALHDLPAEQRRVIVLAYFGGFSHTEIAEHLDTPLGTVKKRIRLGLQKLRRALAREGVAVDLPESLASERTE